MFRVSICVTFVGVVMSINCSSFFLLWFYVTAYDIDVLLINICFICESSSIHVADHLMKTGTVQCVCVLCVCMSTSAA